MIKLTSCQYEVGLQCVYSTLSLTLVAPCDEEMEYESTYRKTVSSGDESKSGLSNPDDEPWNPNEDDSEPSVTVFVNEEGSEYIDSVKISGVEDVTSVDVIVVDGDEEEVIAGFI